MSTILTHVDAWITALLLAALMLAGWALGWWRGRRLSPLERAAPPSKLGEPFLALLGLLLAFTFSLALAKHDQRREMVVTDSNSIGDFYTCASLLKEPVRGKLQSTLHRYVEARLAMAAAPLDEATLLAKLAEIREMQDRIQDLVSEAIEGHTPIAVPLVNTFNGVTSSHASRLAAVRDRLPASIVGLLFLTAVLAMVILGRQQGAIGERHLGATVAFILLVSLVVWVILDLNQPQRGLIVVSQEPLERLLSAMGR